MTTTTTSTIKARRIEGTNAYKATADYQGIILECRHRHASITRARQCGDLFALAAKAREGVNMGRNLAPSERLFARVRGNLARAIEADQPLRVAYNRGICKGLGITEQETDR